MAGRWEGLGVVGWTDEIVNHFILDWISAATVPMFDRAVRIQSLCDAAERRYTSQGA